jgi:DNA-binding transcriptional MocR family regulator
LVDLRSENRLDGRSPRAVDRVISELRRDAATSTPGSALPSVRALVARLGVSPVTVSRALAELARQGVVVTRPGAGTFVAEQRGMRPRESCDWQVVALGAAPLPSELELLVSEPAPRALSLSHGYMDVSLEPAAALSKAARRVLGAPGAWSRAPLDGLPALKSWFAARAGVDVDPSDVLVVQGGQAAIGTALRAVASPAFARGAPEPRAGASVLVESPTYIGAMAAARAAGLTPVPVPSDGGGIRIDFLEQAFKSTSARALYLQPWFSNPTGSVLASERHAEVLRLARQHSAFVIEDDYCHDLSYRGSTPRTLFGADRHGHVIYIGSLTKSVAPSLRVAGMIARGPILTRLRSARIVDDFFVPRPLQEIALEFVTSSNYAKHQRRLRAALAERMLALVRALRGRLPSVRVPLIPEGGFSLWLELPAQVDEAQLVRRAREADVIISPGRPWFPAEPSGPHLRLSVAAANVSEIEQGIARIAGLGVL